jgi:uncharacterized membrane protein
MRPITVVSAQGRNSRRPSQFVRRLSLVTVFPTALLLACASTSVFAAKGSGKPPSEGTAQILPVSLGAPGGCSGSEGRALNTGPTPTDTIVAAGASCSGGTYLPYYWRNGTWTAIALLPGGLNSGYADAVADQPTASGDNRPTITGSQIGGEKGLSFAAMPGRGSLTLPLVNGFVYANAAHITANGQRIVGSNSTDTASIAVRWTWRPTLAIWEVAQLWPGPGAANRASDDGSVVVGSGRVYMDGAAAATSLGTRVGVNDISADGTFIVGYQNRDCTSNPDCEYPVPAYWTLSGGAWKMTYLTALDGVDSQARGVARVNGKMVIVGWGYTKKDAIMRAVAWLPDNLGRYAAPIRLAAIADRSSFSARAEDVNGHGQVLGVSADSGLNRKAVIWLLPQQ